MHSNTQQLANSLLDLVISFFMVTMWLMLLHTLDVLNSLVDQAKVIGIAEKYLGPNQGIALVKKFLKEAGYGELATQISRYICGRRWTPHISVVAAIGKCAHLHFKECIFSPLRPLSHRLLQNKKTIDS